MKKMLMVVAVVGLAAGFMGMSAQGAALSTERDTPVRAGEALVLTEASNVLVYAGAIACVNSNGYAVPAADTAGYAVLGRARYTADNRTAVYSATRTVTIDRGIFRWGNADSIGDADIGSLAYITDDQTVNKTGGGNNIIAGTIMDVDSDGVWVDTGKVGPSGAATPASLAVAGSATVGTTLGVTGAGTFSTNVTVNGRLTVAAGMLNGVNLSVTNSGTGYTNVLVYRGGICTNVVTTGTP